MRVGAVEGGRWRGRPPDGASCSRRAGLQQCKSFVEMCIVSCLSASPACVCHIRTLACTPPGAALVVVCLAVVTLQPRSTAPAVAGCRLVGQPSADCLYAVALSSSGRSESSESSVGVAPTFKEHTVPKVRADPHLNQGGRKERRGTRCMST
jgi:hypothetical protein